MAIHIIMRLQLLSLALGLLLASSGPASAQTRPSIERDFIINEVGVWNATSKFWMTPDSAPLESKAVETNVLLGQFWIVSQFKSDLGGMAFEGHGQFGYDPTAKKFIGTWIDTTSPYLSVMEGSMDSATRTLTMLSKGRDAQTGEESLSKMVTTYSDDDHKTFEMFGAVKGKKGEWWKMMEIKYTREK